MEFIDEMFERLLITESKTYLDTFREVRKQKATIIRDLQRIENGYQLFRKRYPSAAEDGFRFFVQTFTPEDYEKMKRIYGWK